MRNCEGYFIFFISILLYQVVFTFKRLNTEFKGVDSDFDLDRAVENFKIEEYANITEELMARLGEVGPSPMKTSNITSAEITKLIKAGEELVDTSGEKELNKMRRSIYEKEFLESKIENVTNNINISPPENKEHQPEGKIRVKRQGKFEEAAKVSNLKMLRIYLTMFKNMWSVSDTGGGHPFHHSVPKSVCLLFKHRIMKFFFPPVGDEKHE